MSRNAVLRGELIELTAIFQDAAEEDIDPTGLKVSVYPPGSNPELGAGPSTAWVYEATLASGGTGPQASASRLVEKTGTGHYKYTLLVPDDAPLGAAFDRWEGTVDLEDLDETFTFTIVGGGSVSTAILYENNILYVQLDDSIAATDGSTLDEDYIYYLTTTYNPMYSAIRRVRLDLGSLINDIPDDTINFAIFEASLATNANSFATSIADGPFWAFAKREYTTCMAELTLVRALLGDRNLSAQMSKTLGDLSIARGSGLNALRDKMAQLEDCAARWQVTVQTGGEVSPDASLVPDYAVKGTVAEDAIVFNRQWESTSGLGESSRSAANDKVAWSTRRYLRTFRKRNS